MSEFMWAQIMKTQFPILAYLPACYLLSHILVLRFMFSSLLVNGGPDF